MDLNTNTGHFHSHIRTPSLYQRCQQIHPAVVISPILFIIRIVRLVQTCISQQSHRATSFDLASHRQQIPADIGVLNDPNTAFVLAAQGRALNTIL